MSSTPSESPTLLYTEMVNFLSPIIGIWTHGVLFSVTVLCIHTLLITNKSPIKHRWFHIGYVCLLFVLGTCGGAANIASLVNGFVYNREYPGGPLAYFHAHCNSLLNIFGFSSFIVATWLQDGYLLYRFMLIYSIYRYKTYIYAVPILMYLGSIASSCILLSALSKPGAEIFKKTSVNLAAPYWTLSITLNAMLTILIVIRILWARRENRKIPGAWSDKVYTTVATLLIESAALYSVIGVLYLILYMRGNTMQEIPLAILGEVQCISPMLIIYRVAKGAEWSLTISKPPAPNTTGPVILSTVLTAHLTALGRGSAFIETTPSGEIEIIGMKQDNSCSECVHLV